MMKFYTSKYYLSKTYYKLLTLKLTLEKPHLTCATAFGDTCNHHGPSKFLGQTLVLSLRHEWLCSQHPYADQTHSQPFYLSAVLYWICPRLSALRLQFCTWTWRQLFASRHGYLKWTFANFPNDQRWMAQ